MKPQVSNCCPSKGGLSESILEKSKSIILNDRPLLFLIISAGIYYFYDETGSINDFNKVGVGILSISHYLIFAYGLSAYMTVSKVQLLVTRVFSGKKGKIIIMSSLFGGLSPLCSCTVIPLIRTLIKAGVPYSAIMAFWISSPIISISMYVSTTAVLGPRFATAKAIAAVSMGLMAGFMTSFFEKMRLFKNEYATHGKDMVIGNAIDPDWTFYKDPAKRKEFYREFISSGFQITKWITIAFFVEALMVKYTPRDLIATYLGGKSLTAIPLSAIIGIPAYLNGFAAIPFVRGLIDSGMTPAAGLTFIIAGSVTSIPAAMAVFVLVRKKIFFLYLALALSLSVLCGFVFQTYLSYIG